MLQIRTLAVVIAVMSVALNAVPARAASVWDPNDPARRLDIRWVAYQQADGRMRLTVSFYGRFHKGWLNTTRGAPSSSNLYVGFTHDRTIPEYWFALFSRTPRGRLVAWLCESGSSCVDRSRVRRVDRDTIRVRLRNDFGHGPAPGWYFRASSYTHDLKTPIDRTQWGVFT
jgi:hypothetical protein